MHCITDGITMIVWTEQPREGNHTSYQPIQYKRSNQYFWRNVNFQSKEIMCVYSSRSLVHLQTETYFHVVSCGSIPIRCGRRVSHGGQESWNNSSFTHENNSSGRRERSDSSSHMVCRKWYLFCEIFIVEEGWINVSQRSWSGIWKAHSAPQKGVQTLPHRFRLFSQDHLMLMKLNTKLYFTVTVATIQDFEKLFTLWPTDSKHRVLWLLGLQELNQILYCDAIQSYFPPSIKDMPTIFHSHQRK